MVSVIAAEEIQVDNILVRLENKEFGKGTIDFTNGSDKYHFYWGAMGKDIESFIKTIDSDYFATKLSHNRHVFSPKLTVRSIRRFIRVDMSTELPWYKYRVSQAHMREGLRELEKINNPDRFYRECSRMSFTTTFWDDESDSPIDYEDEWRYIMRCVFSDVQRYFEYDYSPEYIWLKEFHSKLKSHLS